VELTSGLALLIAAITLGVIEGIKPGPLMAVVISETIIHDWRAGLKVALVPLITDGPVIILSVFLYELLTMNPITQATIGILGALILIWLGIDCFKKAEQDFTEITQKEEHSLKKGIITNITNPNMYLYWCLIGAPFLINSYEVNISYPFLFVGGFFTAFITLKLIIAILVDNSKDFLSTTGFKRLLQSSGVALYFFSAMFLIDALKILEVI
jgi:threonine/homoserine/homoserine lactone efflux protein